MSTPEIILFHYPFSPYAHKVSWYLALRGIAHAQCLQPPLLPRPDLHSLGITYRRIPVCALDNEVFVDTALILDELERRFPLHHENENENEKGKGKENEKKKEKEKMKPAKREDVWKWKVWSDGVFGHAAGCLPRDLPLMRDRRFLEDRRDFSGRDMNLAPEDLARAREQSLKGLEDAFKTTEKELQDGRDWITGAELTRVDIEAIWPLEWMCTTPGAFSGSTISASTYPRTFGWISRFQSVLPKARKDNVLSGAEAKARILAKWKPMSGAAEIDTPTSADVQFGEEVEVRPVDTGRNHPQKGRVRGLTSSRVVLEVVPTEEPNGGRALRVVFPREGYEVRSVSAKGSARL